MDEKLRILERLFNSFIKDDNPKRFFIGLADYIDYMDAVPEFDTITTEIGKQGQPLFDQENKLKEAAIGKIDVAREEIEAYIKENHLENPSTEKAFGEYDSFRAGKSLSMTGGLPNALAHQLISVLEMLRELPEHKDFFQRYVAYFDKDDTLIREYLPIKELAEYNEERTEIEAERNSSLWGALNSVARLYQTVKRGREHLRDAIDTHRDSINTEENTADPKAFLDVLNNSFLFDEWRKVRDNEVSDTLYFFRVNDVRFWITRIHNYVLARCIEQSGQAKETQRVIANVTPSDEGDTYSIVPRIIIKGIEGSLQIFKQTKPYPIGRINTRQFKLVRRLFNAEGSSDAPFHPVPIGRDDLFEAIRLPKDKQNGALNNDVTKAEAVRGIIEATIDELQKKDVGDYLHFERPDHWTYRLQIRPAEGKQKKV